MQKLEVSLVCPGHGKVASRGLLETQKRYFAEMRTEIKKGIEEKKSLDEIIASIEMPWYKEWTGKEAREIKDNIKHVYEELSGKIDHERLGLVPAPLNWSASPAAVARAQSSGVGTRK